jgi:ubiquinone/menaquinone biosynthesis C-methylase UbiE
VQREILVKLAAKLPKKNLRGPWTDLGCGTGLLEAMLIGPQTKVPIFCVDLTRESLKMLARQNDRPNIFRIQADIDQLPFKPEMFSMAVMSSVIQWLPDPSPSISRANSLLSRGGRRNKKSACKTA